MQKIMFNERYGLTRAAMEMAEWLLGEIAERATSLLKEGGEKK